jgi:Planctomycete cytochrome C.
MKIDKTHLSAWPILFLLILPWILSCTHTANIDNIPVICFEKEVLPVFQNNCAIAGCHDGGGESRFTLNNYVSIRDGVVPGQPSSSRFYTAILGSGENLMPPGKPLTLANRSIVRLWIEQGANLTTCSDTTGQGGGGNVVSRACYSRDIQPVLTSKCAIALCHDVTSHRGGYVFFSYTSTMGAVRPGNPSGSSLYRSIIGGGEDRMPPSGNVQLTTAEIDSIAAWISYGALDQNCGEVCDTINPVTFSGTIWPIMQSSCTGCHSGTTPGGGVSITGYTNISALAASGALMNSLTGNGVTRMPSGSAFSVCRIRQFEIWINNGHLNN